MGVRSLFRKENDQRASKDDGQLNGDIEVLSPTPYRPRSFTPKEDVTAALKINQVDEIDNKPGFVARTNAFSLQKPSSPPEEADDEVALRRGPSSRYISGRHAVFPNEWFQTSVSLNLNGEFGSGSQLGSIGDWCSENKDNKLPAETQPPEPTAATEKTKPLAAAASSPLGFPTLSIGDNSPWLKTSSGEDDIVLRFPAVRARRAQELPIYGPTNLVESAEASEKLQQKIASHLRQKFGNDMELGLITTPANFTIGSSDKNNDAMGHTRHQSDEGYMSGLQESPLNKACDGAPGSGPHHNEDMQHKVPNATSEFYSLALTESVEGDSLLSVSHASSVSEIVQHCSPSSGWETCSPDPVTPIHQLVRQKPRGRMGWYWGWSRDRESLTSSEMSSPKAHDSDNSVDLAPWTMEKRPDGAIVLLHSGSSQTKVPFTMEKMEDPFTERIIPRPRALRTSTYPQAGDMSPLCAPKPDDECGTLADLLRDSEPLDPEPQYQAVGTIGESVSKAQEDRAIRMHAEIVDNRCRNQVALLEKCWQTGAPVETIDSIYEADKEEMPMMALAQYSIPPHLNPDAWRVEMEEPRNILKLPKLPIQRKFCAILEKRNEDRYIYPPEIETLPPSRY